MDGQFIHIHFDVCTTGDPFTIVKTYARAAGDQFTVVEMDG